MIKIIFTILFITFSVLVIPSEVSAQGFVQCDGPECNFCHVVQTFNAVVAFLLQIAVIGSVIILAYAGIKMAVSRGNPGAWSEAKGFLFNVIIGIVIVMLAFTIVDTLMKLMVGGQFGVWNEIEDCGGANPVGGFSRTVNTESHEGVLMDETVPVIAVSKQVGVPAGTGSGFDEQGYISAGGDYGSVGANANITVNDHMQPIFDPRNGGSSMVKAGAAARMEQTLAGPFATLQRSFGKPIVINDAIAKDGTSRETNTPGSRHFHGDALDLSVAGMSDAEKIDLFRKAKQAGFTGFGFGNNILHVDLGPRRGWSYGNSTYGGQSVDALINSI